MLVDEYQDTNLAQYAIVRALSIDHPNLAVTGDPDQSIYGWRGANLENILDFEKDFPNVRVVRLERNYRSTKRILEVAAELIAHNVKRKMKDLYTENGEGEPVRLVYYADQNDEAADIARRIADDIRAGRRRAGDFAVFYRVNALSLAFEKAFRQAGRPLPDGPRTGVLPTQGNPRRPGLPPTAGQPEQRHRHCCASSTRPPGASAKPASSVSPTMRPGTA